MRLFHAILLIFISGILHAKPGAKIIVPKPEAWTGQRLPFFVELRAEGSFDGAPSFDLPEVPSTVIIKVGSPVLQSETEGEKELFVQRHEFALFSQASGALKLPPITARFSHRKGYSGPTFDTSADTDETTLILNRPPNSESLGFIVTTNSLKIEETWDPEPAPLATGTVLKRTIVQRASQLTGIALRAAPTPEIEGIRTYSGNPEVTDKTERGEFLGERRETITYLVQQAGLHALPEIRYDWWNPETKILESMILPSVSFTATAPPVPPEEPSPVRLLWLIPTIIILGAIWILRAKLRSLFKRFGQWINPPHKQAERKFLKACEENNLLGALEEWNHYLRLRHNLEPSKEFHDELRILYAHLYGPDSKKRNWSGSKLASAFRSMEEKPELDPRTSELPRLNP